MAGKRGAGEEGQWEVEDVRRLHRPQQGLLKGLLPPAKH